MNTVGHVLLSVIIPLYAYYPFWRLKKLQKGLIVTAIFSIIPFSLGFVLNMPIYVYVGGYFFSHSFAFFTYRWCRAWNRQIDLEETKNSEPQNSTSDT